MKNAAPEEAYKKFDELANMHIEMLRKISKQVQESRSNHEEELTKKLVAEYEEAVDR
jgi:tetratricopeptide repeat protein 30